ncbi:molybdopterin-synthase adenylyltransferase MoeB [Fulvivirga ligni]|uniref:molybdopterin-synthase adenylyltransferase MoeB n=1 Tax=Fulvivirga ligni TaxID=2904246 RepID=UPI001F286C66|nr:molybdopterin-synthase adenylyltransferase MoeB [Fulvivirga ligni]UII20575.1 molybdopterin-synthase adenylyltransferase MoeB [Fulvivirga ligni]
MEKLERKQYSRQLILSEFGEPKQQLLKQAKVLVVGAGGLGCPVLMYLAGAGVGLIGIMDADTVDVTNLHRQVLYTHEDIGQPKAQQAAKRLKAANPFIDFEVHTKALTNQNALEIIEKYDVVVDGTDNFQTRYLINDACVMLDKPFVYGAISKFEGQVSVFNYKDGPTYRCLFPEPPLPGTVASCAEAGVIGVLPGLIGTYQAMEVIKMVSGLGDVRAGSLFIINTLQNSQYTLKVKLNPENKHITALSDYDLFCGIATVKEISSEQLKSKLANDDITLLDVREPHETEAFNIGGLLIPLGALQESLAQVPKDKAVVTLCQSGMRSLQAAQVLIDHGYDTVYSLKGGLNAWD